MNASSSVGRARERERLLPAMASRGLEPRKAPGARERGPRRLPEVDAGTVGPYDAGSMFDAEPIEGAPVEARQVWTVAGLTRRIDGLVGGLGRVNVEGEVSRITRAASGHLYFDLVDRDAKLACLVWKSALPRALRFDLREGMQVQVQGTLSVFAPRGTYSLCADKLEQAGMGALLARLEVLKRDLQARGWFDRKRPLPSMPRLIGVVTSRDGAAFQDFLRTRSLRWPLYPVRLAHTPVQGQGAAEEIARAIARLDASGVAVIVVCRGGGSLEDLWAFNELPVARAIFACSVPVVSGVGHETDVTLADLVADRRAHTPTDAAQLVIPERAALVRALTMGAGRLDQALERLLDEREGRLRRAARARVLCDSGWLVSQRERDLGALHRALAAQGRRVLLDHERRLRELHRRVERSSPARQLQVRAQRLQSACVRLQPLGPLTLERREQRLASGAARLNAVSPLRILERGYSITTRAGSLAPLVDAVDVHVGDELETRLHSGRLRSRVTSTQDGTGPGPAREHP